MRISLAALMLPLLIGTSITAGGCSRFVAQQKDSIAESHEKTEDAAKDAASAVKEGAETVAEGAKEAVENPKEAAKDAAEATAEKTKQVALSFGHDMHHWPERVWTDLKALPSWRTALVLGGGGALAAISNEAWDEDVRRNVRRHPDRFGDSGNDAVNLVADPIVLFAGSSALYGTSLLLESERVHDFSLDVMSALTIELPAVFVLKKAFHTERPNGDPEGFPSGHVTAAMTLGVLLHEHFGLLPGLAGYAYTGFVSFHRIDHGKHDLSDVLFGAALGYAVGATVGDADEELPMIHARWFPSAGLTRREPGFSLQWTF